MTVSNPPNPSTPHPEASPSSLDHGFPSPAPRGVILMVHGYGNDISWTFQSTPIFLAQHGFACFALDLEGHGRSNGLKAFVSDVDLVVDDCLNFFKFITPVPDSVTRYHAHAVGPNQCCSAAVHHIAAPVSTVWSVIRRFDNPQAYKHFVKSCHLIDGDGNVGTVREVHVISGLPAANSTERLEILGIYETHRDFSYLDR